MECRYGCQTPVMTDGETTFVELYICVDNVPVLCRTADSSAKEKKNERFKNSYPEMRRETKSRNFPVIQCYVFLCRTALLLLARVEWYYTIAAALPPNNRVILAYYCSSQSGRIRNQYSKNMNVWTTDGSRNRESDYHCSEISRALAKKLFSSSAREVNEHDEEDSRSIVDCTKVRYRARLSYDGTHFYGFQYQSGMKRTVQGEVQKVLSKRFNQPVTVVGASRTDTGVHARGQAIHFDVVESSYNLTNYSSLTNTSSLLSRIQYSINRMLPLDVRIFALSITTSSHPYSWHAIKSAKCKLYSYRLFSSPRVTDPLQRYTRACIHNAIVDIPKLNHTLSYFVGTHDFRPFSGSLEQTQRSRLKKLRSSLNNAPSLPTTTHRTNINDTYTFKDSPIMMINTTRTIYRIELVKESSLWSHVSSNYDDDENRSTDDENHNNYRIDFYIQGALYKMIRNIVGAAIEASRVITTDQEKHNKRRQVDENDIRRLLQLTMDGNQAQNSNTTTTTKSSEPRRLLTRKDNLSKPAPPEGLTLEWVFYDNDDNCEHFGCSWRDIEANIRI